MFLFLSLSPTQVICSIEKNHTSMVHEKESMNGFHITYYHFHGFTYSKEVKWISEKHAESIKKQFETSEIATSGNEKKIQKKHDVLSSFDLVDNRNLTTSTRIYTLQDERGIGLFFSKVTGFFGPSSINLLSVLFAAPFFISRAHGISVHISGIFYPSFDFVSFQLVNMRILGYIGLLIVFPFLSIGGYMDGVALIGRINEI
jgi:hypothetical protein